MRKHLPAVLFAPALAITLACTHPALQAAVLVTQQWIMPMAPVTPKGGLQIAVTGTVDPAKPVWVVYQLLAVSAADKPSGSIVLDASLEGVATPITETRVVFAADKLDRSKSAGTIGEKLAAQVGQRTPQELTEALGPELYEAYKALNEKRGAILQGTVVKTLPAPGKRDLRLLASIERASGMQPAQIVVTMGQGEMPSGLTASTSSSSGRAERIVAGVLGLAIAAFFWFRRRR
jgi:MYXO-CTERM domain-containing protein